MSHYRLSRRAAQDLDDIAFDTRRSQPAAQRLIAAIRQKCVNYAANPAMGILRDDLASDLRCFPVRGFVVYYRPAAGGIEVARVLHGSRNVDPSMFLP
jgi:toxin ParE1/3/4